MKAKFLVDSNQFWDSLKEDITKAKKQIYIQTLTFEGDSIGKKLANLLIQQRVDDKRIIIDFYSKYFLSDKFYYFPNNFFNRNLRHEYKETTKLCKEMEKNGVKCKFINPMGFLLRKLPIRDHKKMVIIDGKISYLGGINFSEHNFKWHDMMLRIESKQIADFLKSDFEATLDNNSRNAIYEQDGIALYNLNGKSNPEIFNKIFHLMKSAQKEIYVTTAYLSFPFVDILEQIKVKRNVKIVIVTPKNINNYRGLLSTYIKWKAQKNNFELMLYKDNMLHLKAMLIDNKYLIIGSSNFDYLSYRSMQEIIAIITKPNLISDFKALVQEPDLKKSILHTERVTNIEGFYADKVLKIIAKLSTLINNIP